MKLILIFPKHKIMHELINGTVDYFVFTSNDEEKLNFISWVKFFLKNLYHETSQIRQSIN